RPLSAEARPAPRATPFPYTTLFRSGLAFNTYDPDGLIGDKRELGISCALVPVSTPGVWTGNRHLPVGSVFMNGPTRGNDVFVPRSEEHTSELQSREKLVCRLLLEKK